MKAKVKTKFRDRYTGERYTVGQIISISKTRYDEIMKVGDLVEKIEEAKPAKTTAK